MRYVCSYPILIPRPLRDFISQPWRKIRFFSPWLRDKISEWPGDKAILILYTELSEIFVVALTVHVLSVLPEVSFSYQSMQDSYDISRQKHIMNYTPTVCIPVLCGFIDILLLL